MIRRAPALGRARPRKSANPPGCYLRSLRSQSITARGSGSSGRGGCGVSEGCTGCCGWGGACVLGGSGGRVSVSVVGRSRTDNIVGRRWATRLPVRVSNSFEMAPGREGRQARDLLDIESRARGAGQGCLALNQCAGFGPASSRPFSGQSPPLPYTPQTEERASAGLGELA
jgi:hypothetical protein